MPTKTKNTDDELRAKHPETWIPINEGDRLSGTVDEVVRAWNDQRANSRGGDGWYPLLRVRTDDGPVLAFHAFTEVSYNRVVELQPLPGERIVVTYDGESAKSKPGQSAPRLFSVRLPDRDPKETARNVYATFGSSPRVQQPAAPARDFADVTQGGEPERFDF